jgi:hypothetical protein
MTPQQKPILALRVAHDDEGDVVRRIADLDNARTLNGEVLLALVDGEPVAARSLRDFRASQLTATRRRRRLGLGRVAHRPAA